MKLFVVHTHVCTLKFVPKLSFIQKHDLNQLQMDRFTENCLAENRMLYYLSQNTHLLDDIHVGLASARWNEKYRCMRVHQLQLLKPDEETVYAAEPTDRWYDDSESNHPGMQGYMHEIMDRNGWKDTSGLSFYSNNFVCHRNTMMAFLKWWVDNFQHFYAKHNNQFHFNNNYRRYNPKLHQAYFYERLTILYFANQKYKIKPIGNIEGHIKLL